jgi:hypothetical protein
LAGSVVRTGKVANSENILVDKPEWRSHGISWSEWQNNIKIYCKPIGFKGVVYIYVAHDRCKWHTLYMRLLGPGFL